MWSVVLFGYLKRVALVCIALAMGFLAALAHAQPSAPALETPALQVISTSALITPNQAKLQDVLALAGVQWQTFNPQKTYPVSNDTALWVRLQLAVTTPPNGWSIKVPKPYIDRVEVHLPTPTTPITPNTWTVQAAGDKIAQSAWPVSGLHPQFLLPALPAGEHTIFVKFTNSVPFNAQVQVNSAQDSLADSLGHIIRSAGISILVLCMALISAFMALVYRDTAYAWYSAYAVSAAITAAAYTGLANYLVWPNATFWPERSIHITLLVSLVLQIIFCYVTFEPQKLWPRFTALAWFSGILTVAGIAVLSTEQNLWMYAACLMVPMIWNCLVVVSMVAMRLRHGEMSAKLWMLAYIPLAAFVIITVLEGFGGLTEALLGYYWPLYALAFEVPLLLLALMLRAKFRNAQAVRQHTHQQLDPLTGFLLPSAHLDNATQMWSHADAIDSKLTVVYVQVTQPSRPQALFADKSETPSAESIVRVLRTVFHQDDVYAVAAKDVYAILMPGKVLGESTQVRLTRVIAQIHMLNQELKIQYPLRAKILACDNQSMPLAWADVHTVLINKFNDSKRWDNRNIRYVRARGSAQQDIDTDLSGFWDQAMQASSGQNTTKP